MTPPLARAVAGFALACCLIGLVGVHLPLVEGRFGVEGAGRFGVSLDAAPVLAVVVSLILLALTTLPVLDVARGSLVFTPYLIGPALLAIPLLWAVSTFLGGVVDLTGWLGAVLPRDLLDVEIGSGAVLLVVAEIGILAVGLTAAAMRWRMRSVSDAGPGEAAPSATDRSLPDPDL